MSDLIVEILEDVLGKPKKHYESKCQISFDCPVCSTLKGLDCGDGKGNLEVMEPELRIYNQPNITTSEADIKTNLLSDRFITINIVQNQDYFNIRYQIKPFMLWIWLSVLLITAGGFLRLLKKYEN